ncbi:MAG: TetR/AcrR family transcriptional regulator, partial [Spirochaetales bacterium]|nr:TetR/AcrR family transcriptional regulator [Spirochaetales bacterium]
NQRTNEPTNQRTNGGIMVNQEIQKERMRKYFTSAAEEIIKGEGLRAVSARNIAERAGYSYATLYNYFSDMKEVIFACVKDFQEECSDFTSAFAAGAAPGKGHIEAVGKGYCAFFIQYPSIFELIYTETSNDVMGIKHVGEQIQDHFQSLCRADWEYLVSAGEMTAQEAQNMSSLFAHTLIGYLLMYINRKCPDDYTEFMRAVDQSFSVILNK